VSKQEQGFLNRFFDFLNEERVEYAVIRNYESLPETVPGTDIDLVIAEQDYQRIALKMDDLALSVNYRVWKKFPKNWGITQIKFAPIHCIDPQDVVKIDFMVNGLKWLGYDLMSSADLDSHLGVMNGIKVLQGPACILLTLLNSWTYGGKLKEKYRQECLGLDPDDRSWVNERLRALFGAYSQTLISGLEAGQLYEPPWPVRLRVSWSRRGEWYAIFIGLRSFIAGTIRRVWNPPGEFVVVIGPDGTGKSSLVDKVEAECVRMYKRLLRFHFFPRLKLFSRMDQRSFEKYEARLKEASEWENRQKKRSVSSSLIRCGYHLFRFWAGYLFVIYPERVKGSLVIGERWCYDWLIDPQSKGVGLPLGVRRAFCGLCPKPDKVIVVHCTPDAAAVRKGELPVDEIQRQMDLIDQYIVPLKHAWLLHNEGSLEDGFKNMLQILLAPRHKKFIQ